MDKDYGKYFENRMKPKSKSKDYGKYPENRPGFTEKVRKEYVKKKALEFLRSKKAK